MNMMLTSAAFIATRPHTDIATLVRAHRELEALMATSAGIPDEAMDAMADAQGMIGEAIIEAPITCSKDLAAKFRFAAFLIEDDEAGMLTVEPSAVLGALADLAKFRCAEWDKSYGDYSFPHPRYSGFVEADT